jgi:3-deoxy-D-manno-octulosonic-acid transferase
VLFSEKDNKSLSDYSVFVIDTIGLLSKIYSYADIAYVGGAMGTTGLHNILEPAVFGVPIIIGKDYSKFPEAFEMIESGGLISIKSYGELEANLNDIIDDSLKRKTLGTTNANFILKNKGAVIQILDYIRI